MTPFLLSLTALILQTSYFPSLRVMVFAPFLAIVCRQGNLLLCLWLSLFCGLLLDLCNTQLSFGIFSASYLATGFLAYRNRHLFFYDNPLSIPLYTIVISSLFFAIHIFILFFLRQLPSLSLGGVLTNMLFQPLGDALYAFCWFTCPLLIYNLFRRKGNKCYHN